MSLGAAERSFLLSCVARSPDESVLGASTQPLNWNALLVSSLWHKVAFLVYERLCTSGALDAALTEGNLPLILLNHWKQLYHVNRHRSRLYLEAARSLCAAAEDVGVPLVVAKGGPILFGRLYTPSERKTYDVDFLARQPDLRGIESAMASCGFAYGEYLHGRQELAAPRPGDLRKHLLQGRGLPNFVKVTGDPFVDYLVAQVRFRIGSGDSAGRWVPTDALLANAVSERGMRIVSWPDLALQLALHIHREAHEPEYRQWSLDWNLIKLCDFDRMVHMDGGDEVLEDAIVRGRRAGFRGGDGVCGPGDRHRLPLCADEHRRCPVCCRLRWGAGARPGADHRRHLGGGRPLRRPTRRLGRAGRSQDHVNGSEDSAHPGVWDQVRASADWRQAHTYRGVEPAQRRLTPDLSVLEAFTRVARARPDAPLITEVREAEIGVTATRGEVLRMVARRARALDLAGIPRGSRVGLRPRNTISDLVDILAVQWQGSAAVLANPADAPGRVAGQFGRLDAVDLAGTRTEVAAREALVTDSDLAGELAAGPRTRADDLAVAVFTSGSTGAPRAVGQSHGSIVVNATAVARHHALAPSVSLFACLPLFHVNALEFTCFGAMLSGSRTFLAESFDPFTYLRALRATGAGIASTVPNLLQAVAAGARRFELPGRLRYVVSAAAPLTAATARAVSAALRVPVVQGYGLSEAANFSCLMPVRLPAEAYRRLVTHAAIPPVGPAVWGNEVAVLDPAGVRLPPGEVGEIGIRGHNVMLGYLGDDDATAAAFADGWLRTGDLGRFVVDPALAAEAVQITGRAKHVVKVRGHTVGFEEVEHALAEAPGISGVAAIGVGHPVEGEVLCLLVVADDAFVDAALVRSELSRRLGPDYRPYAVHLVDSLPLLHNGKLDRTAVRTLASRGL